MHADAVFEKQHIRAKHITIIRAFDGLWGVFKEISIKF